MLQLVDILTGDWRVTEAVNPLEKQPEGWGTLQLAQARYRFVPSPSFHPLPEYARSVPWFGSEHGTLRWEFELDFVWATYVDDLYKLQQQLQLPLGMRIATLHFGANEVPARTSQYRVMWMPALGGCVLAPAFHATPENNPARIARQFPEDRPTGQQR